MKEERLKILEMISEGKINAEEGVKLLDALNNSNNWYEEFNKHAQEKGHKFSECMENFAKDISEKTKDMEPKFKEVTKNVLVKTADTFEGVSKFLHEKANKFDEEEKKTEDSVNNENKGENDINN